MNKFYKVNAGMNDIDRTFIVYVREIDTYENLNTKLANLLDGWYIYGWQEIEYRDLEIVTYW